MASPWNTDFAANWLATWPTKAVLPTPVLGRDQPGHFARAPDEGIGLFDAARGQAPGHLEQRDFLGEPLQPPRAQGAGLEPSAAEGAGLFGDDDGSGSGIGLDAFGKGRDAAGKARQAIGNGGLADDDLAGRDAGAQPHGHAVEVVQLDRLHRPQGRIDGAVGGKLGRAVETEDGHDAVTQVFRDLSASGLDQDAGLAIVVVQPGLQVFGIGLAGDGAEVFQIDEDGRHLPANTAGIAFTLHHR
jgi:hypothetical protein